MSASIVIPRNTGNACLFGDAMIRAVDGHILRALKVLGPQASTTNSGIVIIPTGTVFGQVVAIHGVSYNDWEVSAYLYDTVTGGKAAVGCGFTGDGPAYSSDFMDFLVYGRYRGFVLPVGIVYDGPIPERGWFPAEHLHFPRQADAPGQAPMPPATIPGVTTTVSGTVPAPTTTTTQ